MRYCCQMDNAEEALFDEAFLFCTWGSAHSTVLFHKMSDNVIFLL